jgi:hypothetical protein
MVVYCPLSTTPVFFKGKVVVGAQISVYDAQTLTPRQAFRDGLAISSWSQPILSDGNGTIPNIFIVGNSYKIRVIDPSGVQIREVDNLPGDVSGGGGGPGPGGGNFITGDMIVNYGASVITGRVRANGGTIGNTTSGATERANDDVDNLFVWLWNADANLVVSGGRGLSGIADFQANKTIALPDFRARAAFGIDDMGRGASGRLAGALFAAGNATTLGSSGGEAVHTLTLAESAAHTHTGTASANSAFQLTGTTATAGSHSHSGATAAAGVHNHGGTTGSENAVHTHDMSSMGSAGSHNHGGATGFESASLTVANPVSSVSRSFGTTPSGSGGFFSYVNDVNYLTSAFSVTPNHTHTISSDGAHSHGGNTGSQSGNHQHSVSSDGNHTHVISTDGTHAHSFVTALGGVHTHLLTTNSAGGGGSHNTMPPFILITYYLVL